MTLLERMLIGTNLALQVLQARLILLSALLLTAGGFAWAMYLQTQLAAIIAATFAILVFLPILWSGERHATQPSQSSARGLPAKSAQGQSRRRSNGDDLEERDHPRAPARQSELDV
jgi:hypothetical protein